MLEYIAIIRTNIFSIYKSFRKGKKMADARLPINWKQIIFVKIKTYLLSRKPSSTKIEHPFNHIQKYMKICWFFSNAVKVPSLILVSSSSFRAKTAVCFKSAGGERSLNKLSLLLSVSDDSSKRSNVSKFEICYTCGASDSVIYFRNWLIQLFNFSAA